MTLGATKVPLPQLTTPLSLCAMLKVAKKSSANMVISIKQTFSVVSIPHESCGCMKQRVKEIRIKGKMLGGGGRNERKRRSWKKEVKKKAGGGGCGYTSKDVIQQAAPYIHTFAIVQGSCSSQFFYPHFRVF